MIFALVSLSVGFLSIFVFFWMGYVPKRSKVEKKGDSLNAKGLIDYNHYCLKPKEKVCYLVLAALFIYGLMYVFYHSVILSLLFTPLAFIYPPIRAREICEKRKKELNLQFKDALYSLSSSLMAGKSVELAFRDVHQDLALLYPDPATPIIREVEYIVRRLEMNETLEEALADLASRAHSEDIDSFVDVFTVGKRSGGNMVEIIKNTATIITDKLLIKEEIDTLLAKRRFEQRVLSVMPVAMILLLSWSTGDYMAPVFACWEGRVAMTIAVILLGIANYLARKIMTIEV